jgi:predicted PurR-regulated permease PerM
MTADRRLIFWLVGLALFVTLLWLLAPVLPPFVLGLGIAYLLDPPVSRLESKGMPRWAAAGLILGSFFLVVIVLLILLVPLLQAQLAELAARLPGYVQTLQDRVMPFIERLRDQLPADMIAKLKDAAGSQTGQAVDWAGLVLVKLWSGANAILDIIYLSIFTPIIAFYILLDWRRLVRNVDDLLPRREAPVIRQQARAIDRIIAGFLRGQATVCLLLGAFYAVGLTAVRLDFGLLIGLGTGILSFIPFVGMIVGFIIGVAVAYLQFDSLANVGMVIGVFVLGQIIEGNFLTPKLVGDKIGLHAVWVMFALFAGGTLFGFVGVLLAVPIAAVIGVLVRFALERYRASPYYNAPDPPS